MTDALSLESLVNDRLIQPSIDYPSNHALSVLSARISALDLVPLIVYGIDTVEPSALIHLLDQFDVLRLESWLKHSSDTVRRGLVKGAVQYHQIRGTLGGIKKHVALTGAKVVYADLPDNKFYVGESITEEEMAKWKLAFPEVRIYDFVAIEDGTVSSPLAPALGDPDSFLGAYDGPSCFCGGWDDVPRLGRKATLFRDGLEIPLLWSQQKGIDYYEQLRIPGDAQDGFFLDHPEYQDYTMELITGERVLSYKVVPEDTYAGYQHNLLKPGLTPLSVVPERRYEQGVDDLGVYADEACEPHWLMENRTYLRAFDSLRLFDKDHRAKIPTSTAFLDFTRFPVDPFTAELTVQIRGVRPAGAFEFLGDYLIEDQTSDLSTVIDAVQVSQAFRDELYLKTKTFRPINFGDGKRLGTFTFGDWTEN